MENNTVIQTVQCNVCGDVVMKNFIREHMLYVHGEASSNQKTSKKNRKSASPDNQKHGCKKQNFVTNSKIPARIERAKNSQPLFAPYADSNGIVECVLCKEKISAENIENHLINVHRAGKIIQSKCSRITNSQWVHIYQGGLPSLGKRPR